MHVQTGKAGAAPPLPSFLAGNDGRGSRSGSGGGSRAQDAMQVDAEVERKLWLSIMADSKAVPGRNDVFQWRGKVLKQPAMGADGLCIIVEDATGEVVFKGSPPPADLASGAESSAGAGPGSAGPENRTLRLMKDATRVLVSPAVAVVRLSTGNRGRPVLKGGGGEHADKLAEP